MKRHTVILGAGATIAAIPNGDKNGKKSSVMKGLMQELNMSNVLDGVTLKTTSDNLEDIYSEMYCRPELFTQRKELEKRIYKYFSALRLPDEPTVYDFLILSLTEKDAIATFNWDPLLIQAYIRCYSYTNNLPHIYCLHGNVAVGFCKGHKEFGSLDAACPICGLRFQPTKLLYPIDKKDYDNDEYIHNCWDATEALINDSFMLTIFGYSAPSSDKEAVSLLKKAWGNLDARQLEEVSIIDIVDEKEILDKWKDFIYSHHYRYTDSFFHSYLGLFPRRSCETVFATYMLNVPSRDDMGFHAGMTWKEIELLINDLTNEEKTTMLGDNYPLHYTDKAFF